MKQGEIWLVNLEPTLGAEMKKVRPALVVSDDALGKLPLKIIVPITDWKAHYAEVVWMQQINPNNGNGLQKISSIDCFQIRCVAQERLIKKLGNITNREIAQVQNKIAKVIGYDF
jgi:mRNA interferase MazF